MRVYGSRKCDECLQKYDWVGSLDNQISIETQNQILRNRYLQFAKFSHLQMNTYNVHARCPYCKKINEFSYISLSFDHNRESNEMRLGLAMI